MRIFRRRVPKRQPLDVEVRMYSRRTCGLCDTARAVIEAERARVGFSFTEVVIDGFDQLERDFGLRVPVVEVDGVEQFEYEVDPARFRRLVRRRL
jgi:Glutaredoxin-like domain (DUF836)